jgi:serine/threonine protein kinase
VVNKSPVSDQSKGSEPRELQALKRIAHPNIVGLQEVIEDETSNKLVVVMEYLDGTQLS